MNEPILVEPAHNRACYYLLGTGTVVLAIGAYIGFVLHGTAVLVFIVLGASIALFVSAAVNGLKDPAIKPTHPSRAFPQSKAGVATQADSIPRSQQDPDVDVLMATTLGELLLAAVKRDPQGAQRLFSQAGLHTVPLAVTALAGEAKDHTSA